MPRCWPRSGPWWRCETRAFPGPTQLSPTAAARCGAARWTFSSLDSSSLDESKPAFDLRIGFSGAHPLSGGATLDWSVEASGDDLAGTPGVGLRARLGGTVPLGGDLSLGYRLETTATQRREGPDLGVRFGVDLAF